MGRPSVVAWKAPLCRTFASESNTGSPSGSSSSSSGGSSNNSTEAVEVKATPFEGRCVVEGVVLPMADAKVEEALRTAESDSIEGRLQRRLRDKTSSAQLMSQAGDPAGMFVASPRDLAAKHPSHVHRVAESTEHLNEFQSTLKRLRQTGRDHSDERDVSDSMVKALQYMERRKKNSGNGSEGSL